MANAAPPKISDATTSLHPAAINSDNDHFLTTAQASKLLHKSPSTIITWLRQALQSDLQNELYIKREQSKGRFGFRYIIEKHYLLAHFPIPASKTTESGSDRDFITMTEAATITGKSHSTLKRWARQTLAETPANDNIIQKVQTGARYEYKISKQNLLSHFPFKLTDDQLPEVIQILKHLLEKKDEQLGRTNAQIEQRDRIIQILLSKLQKTSDHNPAHT